MTTKIITRTGKGAALSAANYDQAMESFSRTVDAKTADYTILFSDQNKTIEFTKATAVTANLSAVATIIAAIDTTKFRVTIKNLGAGTCTIDPNGAETLDGSATLALLTNESAEVQIDAAGTGWNVVRAAGAMLSWTQTLSNKTLTVPVIATLSPDGVETLTLPVATDTLIGKATGDTLTNKNLAGSNTISAGLTWSSQQNMNDQALFNINIDSGDISGVTVSGSLTWSAAQTFNSGTTVIGTADINGGNVDGTTIGGSTPAAGTFSTLALTTDLAVAHGGTGASTLGNHWVLVGSGTSAITSVSPSTAGLVLMSNGTSADPSFQSVPKASDFANTDLAIAVSSNTGSWNPGFGTDSFVWGISGLLRDDSSADIDASIVGKSGQFQQDWAVGTPVPSYPTVPSVPSTGVINFSWTMGNSARAYTLRLWARKLI
jgi:hypothetical protein